MKRLVALVLSCFCMFATADDAVTDFPVDMLGSINGMAFPRTRLSTTGGEIKGVAATIAVLEWKASANDIARKRFLHAIGEVLEIADKSDFTTLVSDFGYSIYSGENLSRKIYITGFLKESGLPTSNDFVSRVYKLALDPVNNALDDLNDIIALDWYNKSFKLDITIARISLLSSLADIDIYVDRGDVLVVRGLLKAVKSVIYFAHGIDFSLDVNAIMAAFEKFAADCELPGVTPLDAFDASPLARMRVSSTSDLKTAKDLFNAAVTDINDGVALMNNRTDSYNHLLTASDDSIGSLATLISTHKDEMLLCLDQLVSPANLASAQVTTGSLELMYTGKAVSPEIGVATVNGVKVPYELTGTVAATNGGTYSVTLSGYGRSTGTKTISWQIVSPTVPGDSGAKIEAGSQPGTYVITPSADRTDEVVVSLPKGVAPENVTVKVSPELKSVKLNGAKLCITRQADDITAYLDIPTADAQGAIDLTKVVVKESIVMETLDTKQNAVVSLGSAEPSITTAKTRPGLVYTLVEGYTLDGMGSKASKVGDGRPWTPTLSVKGGTSGFYTIRVTK